VINASDDALSAYYADLAALGTFSDEDVQALLAEAALRGFPLDREMRNRLVEAHLALAKHLALKYCPSTYRCLLPDILGDINLVLLQAVERHDPLQSAKMRTYLYSFILGSMRTTINQRRLISIPGYVVREYMQQGTPQLLDALEPLSIQSYVQWLDMQGEDPPMRPLQPTEAVPEPDPAQQALIADWLTHLSARDEQIVRLAYGLTQDDERAYSVSEIALILDLTYATVRDALERSLLRLKKMTEGNVRFREQEGRAVVKGVLPGHPLPTLTAEQEAQIWRAAQDLRTRGMTISMRTLTRASGLSYLHTRAFLKRHREELPPEAFRGTAESREKRQHARMERVRLVYEQFVAEGRPLIHEQIAQEAQVGLRSVRSFLHDQKQRRK
jgi:RNA polymerase sigma factor (sigma-70 family)